MKQLNFFLNTIQGSIWGLLNKFFAIFLPFVVRTIIIRNLGAEYAGLNSLFTSVLQVLSLAELGFASAMVYEMYKPIAENNFAVISALLNYYRKIYFIIGCVVFFIGMSLTPIIGCLINGDVPQNINIYVLYIIYLSNTVLSYFAFAYRASIMSAYQREADNAKIQLITNSLMYAIQIFILLVFANYYAYIIILPIFTLLYNYFRYEYVKKHYPQIICDGAITISQKKCIKKNISALFLHKVGSVTVNTLDNIVISSFLGLVLLANYNNYYYVISAVTSFILVFFNAITAGVGNRLIICDKERNLQDFYSIFYFNGIVVAISTTCLYSSFQNFIAIWVGKEFLFPEKTMALICIYFFIHTIRRTIISYRDAAGMWVDNKWQPIVSSILNLTLNLISIKYIGVNGVICSTIISMILVDIPWETGRLIRNIFNQSPKCYYIYFCLFFVLTIISCFIVRYVVRLICLKNICIQIIVELFIGFFVSFILILIFSFKSKSFQFMCKKTKILLKNTYKKTSD